MPEANDQPKYSTLEQICALLREPPERVNLLIRKHGLPTLGRNRFDLMRVIHWREDQYKRQLELAREARDDRTLPEIAHLLKKEPRWVTELVKKEGLPRTNRGVYNLVDVVRWVVDRYEKQLKEVRTGGETESQARKRLWQIQADLKAEDLARRRGETILIDDVVKILSVPLKVTQTAIRSLAKRLTPIIVQITGHKDALEIEQLLEQHINHALTELADIPNRLARAGELPLPGAPESLADAASPAKAHRKRVGRSKPKA